MSSTDKLPPPDPPEHPEIDEDTDRIERGGNLESGIGSGPADPDLPDPDPAWQPNPERAERWKRVIGEVSKDHHPRREQVYPFLLIRATASGDRGARPLWPPTVCWESPDILLLDAAYTGPFDQSRLVASPQAGRAYRVFVRAWNLGLLPAAGVLVKAWAINPGFFGTGNQDAPYYQQNLIGAAWIGQLGDRQHSDCTALVEMDRPWQNKEDEFGHHCLIAQATCLLDQPAGPLVVNDDRHVGQRNLEILGRQATPAPLIGRLGGLVPDGFTLEVVHAGEAALRPLQAVTGGVLPPEVAGKPRKVTVPRLDELKLGVPAATGRHLLTAFSSQGRTVVALSAQVQRLADQSGAGNVFAESRGCRAFLEQVGPDAWAQVGVVTEQGLDGKTLLAGMEKLADLSEQFRAGQLANRMGGRSGAVHALRFVLTDPDGGFVGGYTVAVTE